MITRTVRTQGEVVVLDSGGVPGISEPPFVVGSAPQWADESDASYADLETFEHPDVSYADGAEAEILKNPEVGFISEGASVVARVRYQSMSPGMLRPYAWVPDPVSTFGELLLTSEHATASEVGSTSPTWVEIPLTAGVEDGMQKFLERVRGEGGDDHLKLVVIAPFLLNIPNRLSRTRIYEAQLIVRTPGGIAPPGRLTGRGDSLDLGGGRLYPFAKTQQGGFRTSGIY